MKKTIGALALVLSLTTVGFASARGGYGGYGMGNHSPQMQRPAFQQVDNATQEKLSAFFAENQGIQKQIFSKQAEMQALMRAANPDPAAVAELSGELFDLRSGMQAKAKAAGLDGFIRGCGYGQGMAMMNGRGGGHRRW